MSARGERHVGWIEAFGAVGDGERMEMRMEMPPDLNGVKGVPAKVRRWGGKDARATTSRYCR